MSIVQQHHACTHNQIYQCNILGESELGLPPSFVPFKLLNTMHTPHHP